MRDSIRLQRQLRLVAGVLILLLGWTGAFLLGQLPPGQPMLWLAPTLLLGCGLGLLVRTVRWPPTACAAILTGFLAVQLSGIVQQRGWTVYLLSLQTPEKYRHLEPLILSVPDELRQGRYKNPRAFYGQKGWSISLFATVEGYPRHLEFGPDGALYVSLPEQGAVVALQDQDGNGVAESSALVANGLDRPYGLAWHQNKLYVAGTTTLYSLDPSRPGEADSLQQILSGLPDRGGHWARALDIRQDGVFFLGVGSSCNACLETDPRSATILTGNIDGSGTRVFASGIRQAGGIWVAESGDVWAAESSRTFPSGLTAPDELNLLVEGEDYGWPRCFGQQEPDPTWGSSLVCRQTAVPSLMLPAGSHPRGMEGIAANRLTDISSPSLMLVLGGQDEDYRGVEGRLVLIPIDKGVPQPPHDLLTGWVFNGVAWAKPVDVAVGRDGAFYISDMRNGGIYRLTPGDIK